MMKRKFINKTPNGQIFKCNKCNAIHIEYKNLNFNFSVKQFDKFADYLSNIDGEHWENKNKRSKFKRKIFIPIGQNSFKILLNNTELTELKKLFFIRKQDNELIQQHNILNMDFTFILN